MSEVTEEYRQLCEMGCWTCKWARFQTLYDSDELGSIECQYNPPTTPGFPWVRPEDTCHEHTETGDEIILVGPKAGVRKRPSIDEYVN